MSKVKNILSVTIASIAASSVLTIGASALTRIGNTNICSNDGLYHANTGYWYGEESSSNAYTFGRGYDDSSYADFEVASGRTAKIIGKSGYEGNYKTVNVTVYNSTTSKFAQNQGNLSTLSTTAADPGNMDSASYMGEIYGGTGSNSDFKDGYIIVLNR